MHQNTAMRIQRSTIALLALLLASCASIGSKSPQVNLQSLRAVPAHGSPLPQFEITLQVINPDREPLRLNGMFYSLELEGKRILSGVSNQLPMIDGYSEALVRVDARVNLLEGIRLISDLISEPRDIFEYDLEVRIESDRRPRTLRIKHDGVLNLGGR